MFIKEHEIRKYLPIPFFWGWMSSLFFTGVAAIVSQIVAGGFGDATDHSLMALSAACFAGLYGLVFLLNGWTRTVTGYQLITHAHNAGRTIEFEVLKRGGDRGVCDRCPVGEYLFRGDLRGMFKRSVIKASLDGGENWDCALLRYDFKGGQLGIELVQPGPLLPTRAMSLLKEQKQAFDYRDWWHNFKWAPVEVDRLKKELEKAHGDLEAVNSVHRETTRLHHMALGGLQVALHQLHPVHYRLTGLVDRIRDTKDDPDVGRSKFLAGLRTELQEIIGIVEMTRENVSRTNLEARFASAPSETITRQGWSGEVGFDLTIQRNPGEDGTPTDLPEE